jgi:hypothetical protein
MSSQKIEFFVFVVVFVLSLLILIFYNAIKPLSKSIPYNFQPFPNISPKDLPDPNTIGQNCYNTLTQCDAAGGCSSCDSNFVCTDVTKDGQYNLNNIKVPAGKWCLPKNNSGKTCNIATGRWVWSADQSCQSSNTSQCWRCLCLYPDLYGGEDQGCGIPNTCQNHSPSVASTDYQSTNKLIGTSDGLFKTQEWDPNSKDSDIIRYSPYTKDGKNNPWFSCQCGKNGDQYFVNLPNDPYNCHLDPCSRQSNYTSSGWSPEEGKCVCVDTVYNILAPDGEFKDTCVKSPCGDNGSWNTSSNTCNCTQGYNRQCWSAYINQSQKDSLPQCLEEDNALGYECYNPCADVNCGGGTCHIDPNTQKTNCDCSTKTNTIPPGPGWCGNYIWGGDNCNKACFPKDTKIGHQEVDGNIDMCADLVDQNSCCSGSYHSSSTTGTFGIPTGWDFICN